MVKENRRRGASTVEAAFLFPLIIGLTVMSFSLMILWYSRWEKALEVHQKNMQEESYMEHIRKLHWEQWGELLGDWNAQL